MRTSQTRILTTHVGSLPRNETVLEFLEERENRHAFDTAAFDRSIRQAVLDIVKRQTDVGIDIVSDGETSKISYATYVHNRLTGFSEEGDTEASRPHADLAPFPDLRAKMAKFTGARRFKRVACIGPIAVQSHEGLTRDLANLRDAVDAARPAEAFLTAASPASSRACRHCGRDAGRLAAIVAAGFVLQIDCPDLAMSRHTAFQQLSEPEFLKRTAFHAEALNHALDGISADKVRIHVCWGNYEGPHTHDIDLAKIINTVFGVRAQGIALEAANPRHAHEWAVWKDIALPDDKVLLPGVIDTSTNYVEHPALVAERIVKFASVVGRERVIANTDCGFGTAAGHGKLDPEVVYLKLDLLVAGAALASKELWG